MQDDPMADAARPHAIREVWEAEPVHAPVEQLARESGQPVYIVGGAVRDALLGHAVEDWDLCTVGARAFAHCLAALTSGRLVTLHERLPTYRVILDRSRPDYCVDVGETRAGDIRADLPTRDLTINALACDVLTHELLDPLGGLEDLRAGRLRAIGLANLQEDALRCLRVYRLHSELDFAIEPQTRAWLREAAPLVAAMPGERLGEELLKTLVPPRATGALRLMDEDGLLGHLLPEIEPMRGMEQGRYHHLDVWGHTLEVVAQLELILQDTPRFFPHTRHEIARVLDHRHARAVLLLAGLLHDIGKPASRVLTPEGWWRFYEHDRRGAEMARAIARRFRLRRKHTDEIAALIRNHLRPLQLAALELPQDDRPPEPISQNALLRLYRSVHPHGVALTLLALADIRACRGPATLPGFPERVAVLLDDMLRRYLDWRHARRVGPLLTGKDLIAAGYAPGQRFGAALAAVEEAHVEDLVNTKAEALDMARQLLDQGSVPAGD
jgi:putative nucleotidyltransferase with HDIG domain